MTDAEAVQIARLSDAAQLGDIADDVFDGPIDPQALAHYLNHPGCCAFIAVELGRVVGQIRGTVQPQLDGPTQWFIDNLGVYAAHQRRGIGRCLFEAMAEEAKRRGASEVFVFTEPNNVRANAFYRALGLARQDAVMFDRAL